MIIPGDLDPPLRHEHAPVPVAARRSRVHRLFNQLVLRLLSSQKGDGVAARVLATNDVLPLAARHLELPNHLLADGRALRARDGDPVLGLQNDAGGHVPLQQLVPLVHHHERLALVAHQAPVHRRRPRRRAPRRRETLLLLLLLLPAVPTELLVGRWKLVPVRGQPLTASAVVHPTIYRL